MSVLDTMFARVCVYVSMCVCMYVCMRVCVYVWWMSRVTYLDVVLRVLRLNMWANRQIIWETIHHYNSLPLLLSHLGQDRHETVLMIKTKAGPYSRKDLSSLLHDSGPWNWVSSRVPQSSVLEPLLFASYIIMTSLNPFYSPI